MKKMLKEEYESLPWKQTPSPTGMLTLPSGMEKEGVKIGDLILTNMLPSKIFDVLREHMECPFFKKEDISPMTCSKGILHYYYKHVGRNAGSPGTAKFTGWQVQVSPGSGEGLRRLGLVWESKMGALIVCAAQVDKRLMSQTSAHSWILDMVQRGETAVDEWLQNDTVRSRINWVNLSPKEYGA